MKVWMLFLLVFSYSAFSSEFSYIKLDPEFEEYLNRDQLKSKVSNNKFTQKSITASKAQLTLSNKVRNVILGTNLNMGDFNSPIAIDGEESPLYEEIRNHLEAAHQEIGLSEVQNINRLNQQFNLGSSNFSGFSWQKPFGVVQVYVDRQVTPNIFGQNWLIMDTFTIEIEASTFLEKLSDAGLSSMNSTEIGAFAGITFKRVYTNWHYSNSYQGGLMSDFSKLFLPFLKFNAPSIEKMNSEEVMKREDTWTARAGGLITSPPLYNISFSGGVLAQHDFQNITTIQNHPSEETKYKIGVFSKRSTNVGATLELQLDFFKLLKLSLLRYDLNYEYAAGKEFTLGIRTDQWAQIKKDKEDFSELKSLLKGTGSVNKLEHLVVRLDESNSSQVSQRGSLLIWGKMQKQKTEQIKVIKDDTTNIFYKNYAQNVKIVQNIFSRIFSAIVYKILKLPIGVNNAAVYSRQVTMEYEATHPKATDPAINRLDRNEQFSFVLTQYYNAARTDRWVDRKFKNDLTWFVDNFTTLPKTYKTDIRNEVLKGPMVIESNLRVDHVGFKYLLDNSENNVFNSIAETCNSRKTDEWSKESSRTHMMQEHQSGRESCVKEIGKLFIIFKNDYISNFNRPSIAKFKSFITKYYKKASSISQLVKLFGPGNTFISGKLQASTSMGIGFNTTFSSGQFRGLGVIDNFKRSSGSRMPATIASE